MHNQIQIEIVKVLIHSVQDYMTAQEIADCLHVSRRTIFNNLKEVAQLCSEYGANLVSVKSKGYKIQHSSNMIVFIKKYASSYTRANHQEYKLYILYLLLSDETYIHISELEDIMYLSRPTIYKLLGEISSWLNDFEIELVISRKGIYLKAGEKRLRSAIKSWIVEVNQYYDSNKKKQVDYFKLKSCLKEFITIEFHKALLVIEWICELNKIHLSQFELMNMTILLEVIVYRINLGYYAHISDQLYQTTCNFYSKQHIDQALDYLKKYCSEKLTDRELVYFMTSVLINADLEDRKQLSKFQQIELNPRMIHECERYLKQHLCIQDVDFNELIEDIQFVIRNEVLLQIKGETGKNSKHYDSILKNFRSAVIMAKELYQIISNYYSIEAYEKTISKLSFSILSAAQKNKRNLKIAFYHDCDMFEFKYVLLCLQRFPFISLVYVTDQQIKLDEYLENNHLDMIISTVDYQQKDLPVLIISKVFGRTETIENIKMINQLYQQVNFEKIIKNIDIKI